MDHNGELIGELYVFLDLEDKDFADGNNTAYLCAFRVKPEYRGRGLGTSMMEKALKELKGLSASLVKLRIDPDKVINDMNNGKVLSDIEKSKERTKLENAALANYLKKAEEVEQYAAKYLKGKVNNINSKYAQRRFDMVKEVFAVVDENRKSFEATYKKEAGDRMESISQKRKDEKLVKDFTQKKLEWRQNIYKKYEMSAANGVNRKVYFGKDYTEQQLGKVPCKFTIARGAGINLTNYLLMLETENGKPKYSIDDILDPSRLQEEKANTFKKVVEKTTSGDLKWTAEIMYEGDKVAKEYLGQLLKKVDYDNPDFAYTEEFMKALRVSEILFDIYQEEDRIPEVMFEVIKEKEKDLPEDKKTKSYEEYYYRNIKDRGYIDYLSECMDHTSDLLFNLNDPLAGKSNKQNFTADLHSEQELAKLLKQKVKECKDKPYTEWFTMNDRNLGNGIVTASRNLVGKAQVPNDNVFAEYLPEIIKGNAFKNIKATFDPDAPVKYELHGEIDFASVEEDSYLSSLTDMKVVQRIDSRLTYFDELKRSSDEELRGYINGAIKGITELAKYRFIPSQMTEQEKQKVAGCVKDVFKAYLAMEYKKVGASGDALNEAIENSIEEIQLFKRFTGNIGLGKLTGVLIADLTQNIEGEQAVLKAKAKIAKNKLENGEYRKDSDVLNGFAHAYAYAMYEANGKLPFNPAYARGRFNMYRFIETLKEDKGFGNIDKNALKRMKKDPDFARNILNDQNGLKQELARADERTLQARNNALQNAKVNNPGLQGVKK